MFRCFDDIIRYQKPYHLSELFLGTTSPCFRLVINRGVVPNFQIPKIFPPAAAFFSVSTSIFERFSALGDPIFSADWQRGVSREIALIIIASYLWCFQWKDSHHSTCSNFHSFVPDSVVEAFSNVSIPKHYPETYIGDISNEIENILQYFDLCYSNLFYCINFLDKFIMDFTDQIWSKILRHDQYVHPVSNSCREYFGVLSRI